MVLTELRKIYKISMQDLADGISVSKQLIGQIEKGNRSITLVIAKKLAHYFGITSEIANDISAFFTKDSLDELELLKVKKAKIEKEAEDIEYEYTDPYSGDTYMRHESTLDVTSYIYTQYEIERKELLKKIESRLEGIIGSSLEEQEKNNGFASMEQAISEASDKVVFYEKLINLDEKVDPYIYKRVVRALTLITGKGFDSDPFTRKIVKLINAEMDKQEKERQKNYNTYKELFGEYEDKTKKIDEDLE